MASDDLRERPIDHVRASLGRTDERDEDAIEAVLAVVQPELDRLREQVEALSRESDIERLHADNEDCPVCTHLSIEQVCDWNDKLITERDEARAALARVAEVRDRWKKGWLMTRGQAANLLGDLDAALRTPDGGSE